MLAGEVGTGAGESRAGLGRDYVSCQAARIRFRALL